MQHSEKHGSEAAGREHDGSEPKTRRPRIVLIATGGTIAGSGAPGRATNYRPGQLEAGELVASAPGIEDLAKLSCRQLCNLNSDDIESRHWIELARLINGLARNDEADGFVITHGSDTLEETAYFLNLTLKTDRPVVLTGSMRPASSLSADGPMNLRQAVTLAAHEEARGQGVLVAFADLVYGARDVRKASTFRTEAFSSLDFGCLGYMAEGLPRFYQESTKRHTLACGFDIDGIDELPRVDVLYFNVDANPDIIDRCIEGGARGIVVAGAGAGCYSSTWNERIASYADAGIPFVRSSRIGCGMVTRDDFYRGSLIEGNDLPPHKAALLLRLALTETSDLSRIQAYFDCC